MCFFVNLAYNFLCIGLFLKIHLFIHSKEKTNQEFTESAQKLDNQDKQFNVLVEKMNEDYAEIIEKLEKQCTVVEKNVNQVR